MTPGGVVPYHNPAYVSGISKPSTVHTLLADLPNKRVSSFRILFAQYRRSAFRFSLIPDAALIGRDSTETVRKMRTFGMEFGQCASHVGRDWDGYRRSICVPPVLNLLYSSYKTPRGISAWRFGNCTGDFEYAHVAMELASVPIQVEMMEGVEGDPVPTLVVFIPGLGPVRSNLEALRFR